MSDVNSFIRIKGNLVQQVEERIQSTVTLDSLMANIEKQLPTTSGLLPPNCRYFSRRGDKITFVIELPPQVRTMVWQVGNVISGVKLPEIPTGRNMTTEEATAYNNIRYGRTPTTYRLALPYCVFVFDFTTAAPQPLYKASIYGRTTPLSSTDDKLYALPLPNVASDCAICIGEFRIDTKLPVIDRIAAYIGEFWQAQFNNDLSDNILRYTRGRTAANATVTPYATLLSWQKATEENPLFPLSNPLFPLSTQLMHVYGFDNNSPMTLAKLMGND